MRTSFLVPSLLLPAALLPAQTWVESGDAGSLPRTAQVPIGTGPVTQIQGSVTFNDADVYLIQIDNPATFSATTIAGAQFDTQLFLFDQDGRGVVHNDDKPGTYQSAITGQFVGGPGRYYLAVAGWDHDPIAANGQIWGDVGGYDERTPDGERAGEVVQDWWSSANGQGSYTIFLTGASCTGKQLVLPDNHHLSESPYQTGVQGSTQWWRAGGGRFHLVYEGSHFVAAGVNGPITIDKLMFRGEDGEPNLGGVTWPNATVRIGSTSLNGGTLSSSFATNLSGGTTTIGATLLGPVTMRASIGSTPNNYNIVVDFAGLGQAMTFDPTSARPNLFVEVLLPSAAVLPAGVTAVMPIQDTTGDPFTIVRGAGVNAGTSGASVGSHENPPVLGIEFTGGGGNRVVVPARNEAYGAACGGSPSAFYQAFLNGQAFDLRGLALTPNDPATPTYYTVSGAAEPVDPTFTDYFPESTADDGVVAHPLGFTFYFPGGSTNAIVASTNGFVWLASGVAVSDFSPTLAELLGSSAPRLAPFWCDLNCGRNVTTHPLAGLHVQTDTTGGPGNAVCYVTWRDVGVYNSAAVAGTAVHTFQLVLRQATGAVEFRYGSMPRHAASSLATNPSYPVLVGFSRGQIGANPSADPRSRDLSLEVPFTTFPEGGVANLGLSSIGTDSGGLAYGARAFAGQSLYWTADNVPPTAVLGVCLLDIVAARPGFSLPTITAPGCILSTSANAVLWELHVTPGASATTSHPFVVPPGFDGVDLHAQYVVLGGLFGAPDLITVASNALRHTVGRR